MDSKSLLGALIYARACQLFYHYCHNLSSGDSFFQDHEFFGANYERLEDDYDLLTEYYISIFGASNLPTKAINDHVTKFLNDYSFEKMSVAGMLQESRKIEQLYQDILKEANKLPKLGLQNAIGDICQASDNRVYKIKQRLR